MGTRYSFMGNKQYHKINLNVYLFEMITMTLIKIVILCFIRYQFCKNLILLCLFNLILLCLLLVVWTTDELFAWIGIV